MNDIVANNSDQMTRAERWASHGKRWDESKLSQPAYCKQAGISYTSFVYWRCKLTAKSKASQTNFLPITVAAKSSASAEPPKAIQIKLASGHVVYIPTNLPISDIAALINAIGNAHA